MYKHARAPRLLIHDHQDSQLAALRDALVEVRGLARATPGLSGQQAMDLLQQRLNRRGISIRDELAQTGCLAGLPWTPGNVGRRTGRGAARARRRLRQLSTGNWRPIEKALTDLLTATRRSLHVRNGRRVACIASRAAIG